MCTYSFTFDDTTVDQVRQAFADDTSMQQWMQHQLETIMLQYAVTHTRKETKAGRRHTLSHLRGILDTEKSDVQLLAETINEKYGL